jgi:hypothetical protein
MHNSIAAVSISSTGLIRTAQLHGTAIMAATYSAGRRGEKAMQQAVAAAQGADGLVNSRCFQNTRVIRYNFSHTSKSAEYMHGSGLPASEKVSLAAVRKPRL